MVDIIIPVVQTQDSPLYVPYAKIVNIDENTNHAIVDIVYPKLITETIYLLRNPSQRGNWIITYIECAAHSVNIAANESHSRTNQ